MPDVTDPQPDKRLPQRLHPAYFDNALNNAAPLREGEEPDTLLSDLRGAYVHLHAKLAELHDRKETILKDETTTAAHKQLLLAKMVENHAEPPMQHAAETVTKATDEVKAINERIIESMKSKQSHAEAAEMRQHLKAMSAKDRRAFLAEKIKAQDADWIAAALAVKPELSGLTQAEALKYRREWEQAHFGEDVIRRSRLEAITNQFDSAHEAYMRATFNMVDFEQAKQYGQQQEAALKAAAPPPAPAADDDGEGLAREPA